ncbi:MAG: type II toxin-antitoxin system VapC family toxin [Thermofilaceae archaeon]|jgi:predicted nucleic acid-binding protein
MEAENEIYYLDTSAIVKRYVEEEGSDAVDEVYRGAYRGVKVLALSSWNLAEAVVVFDKYSRRIGLNAREATKKMMRETATLSRLHRLLIIGVSPFLLRASIELVLKYHIYVADALQIVSAKKANSSLIVTGDRKLVSIAGAEGLECLYVGER